MTRAELIALEERVEKATEQAVIYEVVHALKRGDLLDLCTIGAWLEVAASLVPADHAWACYGGKRPEGRATAYCVPRKGSTPWPAWVDDVTAATTPALALTAAALRALAQEIEP